MDWGRYKVHPAADLFAIIPEDELQLLGEDIRDKGQRSPILLGHDGVTIIDGRNRFQACQLVGVEPEFEQIDPDMDETDILDLIVSNNMRRRDDTPSQKAIVGLALLPMYEAAAEQRLAEGRKRGTATSLSRRARDGSRPHVVETTRDHRAEVRGRSTYQAGRAVGVSTNTMARAKAVQRDAPDLLPEVKSGRMSLSAADKVRKERLGGGCAITDPLVHLSGMLSNMLKDWESGRWVKGSQAVRDQVKPKIAQVLSIVEGMDEETGNPS